MDFLLMNHGVANARINRVVMLQAKKFTQGDVYHAGTPFGVCQIQNRFTMVAKGSSPKSSNVTSRHVSPMTRKPYNFVLRQGRRINRATPRELATATNHTRGVSNGRVSKSRGPKLSV